MIVSCCLCIAVLISSGCASLKDRLISDDSTISTQAVNEYFISDETIKNDAYNYLVGYVTGKLDDSQSAKSLNNRKNAELALASINPYYILCNKMEKVNWWVRQMADYDVKRLNVYDDVFIKFAIMQLRERKQLFRSDNDCLLQVRYKYFSGANGGIRTKKDELVKATLDALIVDAGDAIVPHIQQHVIYVTNGSIGKDLKHFNTTGDDKKYCDELVMLLNSINTENAKEAINLYQNITQQNNESVKQETEKKRVRKGKIYLVKDYTVLYALTLEDITYIIKMDQVGLQTGMSYNPRAGMPERVGDIKKGEKFKILEIVNEEKINGSVYSRGVARVYIYSTNTTAYIFTRGVGGKYIPQIGFEQ